MLDLWIICYYNKCMEIEYDPKKNDTNIAMRGIDFQLVRDFEFETSLRVIDNRKDYGETRYFALGYIHDRLYALVYTNSNKGVRVISLRKANEREVKRYEQET